MPRSDIAHRVERTRNKHSRAVFRDNTIVIRLAKNLSQHEEQEHIQSLLRRMMKQVLKEQEKRIVDPFRPLLQGEQDLTVHLERGISYHFRLLPGTRTKAVRTDLGWDITVGPDVRRMRLHRLLWSLLAEAEQPRMYVLVEDIDDATYRAGVRDVRLSYAASQWGSCSRSGVIMLNTILLFMPRYLMEYVIIHELAHRKHPNHSDTYWRHVERACPDYLAARRALHQYRICSL
jgi:predicted metal-dependent hydrolase